jgi:hypothetical protein
MFARQDRNNAAIPRSPFDHDGTPMRTHEDRVISLQAEKRRLRSLPASGIDDHFLAECRIAGERDSRRFRITAYVISIALLITALAAFSTSTPDRLSRMQRFFGFTANTQPAYVTTAQQNFQREKMHFWTQYRADIKLCALHKSGYQDACFEQARRDRKQTLAELKKTLPVATRRLPATEVVALY